MLVAQLNAGWRVVDDGELWILQSLLGDEWLERARCGTRHALEYCVGLQLGEPAVREIVNALQSDLPAAPKLAAPVATSTNTNRRHRRGLIAQINENWRIIRDGPQWILERRHPLDALTDETDEWRARARCRMRSGLEHCIKLYVTGDVDPAALAILAALPGHIDWK